MNVKYLDFFAYSKESKDGILGSYQIIIVAIVIIITTAQYLLFIINYYYKTTAIIIMKIIMPDHIAALKPDYLTYTDNIFSSLSQKQY